MTNKYFAGHARLTLLAIAMTVALAGCSKPRADDLLSVSDRKPMQTQALLRGSDLNQNGIRDEVEVSMGDMTPDLTTRLRLLSFAWGLQQGMEVAALGTDEQVMKASQIIADQAACVTSTDSNASIAQNLIDIYSSTVNTPLRKAAWEKLGARTAKKNVAPSANPCAQSDVISASILSQSKKTFAAAALAGQPAQAASSPASATVPATVSVPSPAASLGSPAAPAPASITASSPSRSAPALSDLTLTPEKTAIGPYGQSAPPRGTSKNPLVIGD